jgi:hypothetical protein
VNYPLAKSLEREVIESASPYMAVPQYGKFAPDLKAKYSNPPGSSLGGSMGMNPMLAIGIGLVGIAVGFYMYKKIRQRGRL